MAAQKSAAIPEGNIRLNPSTLKAVRTSSIESSGDFSLSISILFLCAALTLGTPDSFPYLVSMFSHMTLKDKELIGALP